MPARIHKSPFPDINLVEDDLLSFLLSNPFNTPPTKPLFVDAISGETYTYAETIQRTKSLAYGLRRLGVKRGDIVSIFSPNTIDYPILCYAILGCGATISPMNAALTVAEVHHQLTVSGAKYIIVHESLLDTAQKAAKGTQVQHIIRDRARSTPAAKNEIIAVELAKTCPSSEALLSLPKERLDTQPAFICFSSGTTGAAKGVEISHNNLTANIQQWQELYYSEIPPSPTAVAFLPFSHIYAVNAIICGALYRGTTMAVLPRFDLDVYLRSIQTYKPDELHLVPPIALMLWKDPRVQKYDLSSVRRIMSAAAPLSAELGDAVENKFKATWGTTVHCHQGWGLTETSPAVTGIHTSRWNKRRTVGCVGPNMEIRLVDNETGEDVVDPSQQGEVWVRGPNVVKGYYRNEEATKEAFHIDEQGRRWFKTGDIATIDQEGYVVIRDRIKEMIKYKGLQVIPSELEGKLIQHPDIEDCGVTALWDESQATELPVAFVVLKSASRTDPSQDVIKRIHEWLNARVANHKKLRGGIRIVDGIPKSPSGKILRRVLKDSLKVKPVPAKL
ncbi:hypothetical protein jhhlp_008527 [Lomentospora prolificans]|uniref:AMP-dependent synthetase/ligase domain-containing protein n=1 Tax=Lomentospora prolificans TaxID=41688 RepID=A0A2N3MYA2_9PEZI|nr:hypothetical protein jhhlp_008527 [Lomentospora prolificans]